MPFAQRHPLPGLAGRWHVQVFAPGREAPITVSGPMSQEQARRQARRVWRQWPTRSGESAGSGQQLSDLPEGPDDGRGGVHGRDDDVLHRQAQVGEAVDVGDLGQAPQQ